MFGFARPLPLTLALAAAIPAATQAASPASPDQIGAAIAATIDTGGQVRDVQRAKDGLFYVDVLITGGRSASSLMPARTWWS